MSKIGLGTKTHSTWVKLTYRPSMDIFLKARVLCLEYEHVTTLNNEEYIHDGQNFYVPFWDQQALAQLSIKGKELLFHQDQNRIPLFGTHSINIMPPENNLWRPSSIGVLKLNVDATWTTHKVGTVESFAIMRDKSDWNLPKHLLSPHPLNIQRLLPYKKDFRRQNDLVLVISFLRMIVKKIVDELNPGAWSSSVLGLLFNQIWPLMENQHITIHFVKRTTNIPIDILPGCSISNYLSNILLKLVPDVIFTAV